MVQNYTLLPTYLIIIGSLRVLYSFYRIFSTTNHHIKHFYYRIYLILLLDLLRLIFLPKIHTKRVFLYILISFIIEVFVLLFTRSAFKAITNFQNGFVGLLISCILSLICMIFLWPCYVEEDDSQKEEFKEQNEKLKKGEVKEKDE